MTTQNLYPNSPSMATVDVPRRNCENSQRPTDSVHLAELGPHIAKKVEAALSLNEGAVELAHYLGVAKGAQVIDEPTGKMFQQFVDGMTAASDQRVYFNENVKPILYRMKAAPRGKK